jgi:hypothetical protein
MTAAEILDHLGPAADARRKAELTSMQEFTGPNATAARQAAYQAAAAKGTLEAAQAGAAGPLVQPAANLQAAQLARQQADLKYAGGVTAYTQYAPMFGEPAIINGPDGNPDFDQMGQKGNHYQTVLARKGYAVTLSEPGQTIKGETANRQEFTRIFSKAIPTLDITPGSPAHQQLQDAVQNANNEIFGAPGSVNVQPTTAAPAPPEVSTPAGDAARAAAMEANPNAPGSQIANLSTPQAKAVSVQPLNTPSAPVEKPTVQPGQYSPGVGLITGPSKNQFTSEQIGADLRKQKSYELWDQQKGFAQSFETTANKINAIPVAEQRSAKTKMNTLDIALAESIIKMYDPGMAIREFKWDKLAEAQPYLERLPNWKPEFLKTGTMTPEGRQRLIEMGYDNINGKDAAVLPHIQLAAQRAQGAGMKPTDVLNGDEIRVLNKKAFGTQSGTSTTAPGAPAGGKTVTIPGLGTGIYDPKSGIFTRTQ